MWLVTNKGNQQCRMLADRHYSRQKIGSKQFCRRGHNLVLRAPNAYAVWVAWTGIRDEGNSVQVSTPSAPDSDTDGFNAAYGSTQPAAPAS